MKKPNWSKWRLKREVKVWEVCVLAVGFEPPKNFEDLAIRRNTLLRSFPTHEIAKKYEDLLEILIDNLSDDNYFNIYVNPRSDKFGDVRVDEFVAWATSEVKWLDLPPELAGLILDKTNGDSAQTQAKAAPAPVSLTGAQAAAEPIQEQTETKATTVPVTLTKRSVEDEIASWFDGVSYQQLAGMFKQHVEPKLNEENWKSYAREARNNGLNAAKVSRGKFNPYIAGHWWLDRKNPSGGWTTARVNRTLANNLPARSLEHKQRLSGDV